LNAGLGRVPFHGLLLIDESAFQKKKACVRCSSEDPSALQELEDDALVVAT
jgi:hypothetical protein